MQLGFIGVGNIGTPICQHLINAGHNISAYDIDRENLEYIASLGAKPSDTPRQVAELSDIVFSSLPGPKEIEDVVLGTDGIITAQKPGLMYADLSTNNPSSAKFVSEHLINAGMSMIDAPVSGGVIGAKQGTLAVMVGGDISTFEACYPLFQQFATNAFYLGDIGNGCVAKLVNNMLFFANTVAAAEGMILGTKAGIDPRKLAEVIQTSTGDSWALDQFPKRVFSGNFEPGFMIDLAHKDLSLALSMGDELKIPLLMGSICINMMRQLQSTGNGRTDVSSLIRLLEDAVNCPVRVPEQT